MAVKAPEEVGLNGQLYVNTETSYTHTYVCPWSEHIQVGSQMQIDIMCAMY